MKFEGQIRIPSGCSIAAVVSKSGKMINGATIVKAMIPMHDRSNGLGGGFAAYGIYPDYKDYYAFHIFFNNEEAKKNCETYLKGILEIVKDEPIPTKRTKMILDAPIVHRYFVKPLETVSDEKEYINSVVNKINNEFENCFIFSSGKNMGVFKGVGYPEDVAEFYMLDQYEGYLWTAHGRYPTNTPGWWGGAHPFNVLDATIVHNGEVSSYDANRRAIEMYGYKCNLQTDSEVVTYIMDYLIRKQGLSLKEAAKVIAAPFWSTIENIKDEKERKELTYLRTVYSSMLLTGPFSIIYAFNGGFMALNDRLKLRSMVVGYRDDYVYVASEQSAILAMDKDVKEFYSPKGGEPIIVKVEGGKY